ncbi:hypothetical protein HJD18_14440 [Thermoleophilia bacterium SCSIO 60948]|nr:hypothetical protein HJD18_14440 [Thermoleophilia bacterium SCSIO 60948]
MPGIALALAVSVLVAAIGIIVGAYPVLILIPIILGIAIFRWRTGPADPHAGRTRHERENQRVKMQAARPAPGTTGRPESGEG